MPLRIDRRDRKLLLGSAVVFVLLIAGAIIFGSESGPKQEAPTSYSTASGGAKAAYLLLLQSGYNVQRWEKPLTDLPKTAGTTVILADPMEAPTRGERESLKTFLSDGGRIIATGMYSGTFLPENDSVSDMLLGMTSKKAAAVSPSVITRAAPEITIAPQARWPSYSAAYSLYGDGDEIVVVKYPYGRGEVLWWAAATPLTNAGLKEPGNLEFLLACLGNTKSPVLFDEYIHGYREDLGSSVAHSPVRWLLLQFALLGLAVVATFSRRSGPLSAPVTDVRLSPLEFVQTLGGLYENAGTASVAVDICYQRFRYWLTRRLGVAFNISINDLEAAVRDRFAPKDDHFGAVLRRCESAKVDPYLGGTEALHLVQELDEYASRWKLFEGRRKEKAE
ncbi:MAG: hypothetical protein DMG78_11270 [Acidobacteria bacterium]|nr:MAG: hypothetical protein DMG78_11270 [Acidobacteriota bacterium]